MNKITAYFLCAALLAFPALAEVQFREEPLAITSGEKKHEFTVEIAETPEQMAQGLMMRQSLDTNRGMLFPVATPRNMGMWMKNTLLSLDMLFIDAEGKIVYIAEKTTPLSTNVISSGYDVSAVLELMGGTTAELNIMPGDVVSHPHFKPQKP